MTNFNNQKPSQETELCFAVTVLMLNFLILAVMTGIIWLLYSLFTQSSLFEASMREFRLF